MELSGKVIHVSTGTGQWWGCALEIQGDGKGENLSEFASGHLHLEIRGETRSKFQLGFQTGHFSAGTQVNCFATFGPEETYRVGEQWETISIPVADLVRGTKVNLEDVTGLLAVKSEETSDGKEIQIRNAFWSQD